MTRYESYFVDYDFIPLMIQQNYLDAVKRGNAKDSTKQVEQMVLAADAVCDSDIVSDYVRGKGAYC